MERVRVLIVCTGNSARSQIAEDRFDVTNPHRVHTEAVAAVSEIGIDVSRQLSKPLAALAGRVRAGRS